MRVKTFKFLRDATCPHVNHSENWTGKCAIPMYFTQFGLKDEKVLSKEGHMVTYPNIFPSYDEVNELKKKERMQKVEEMYQREDIGTDAQYVMKNMEENITKFFEKAQKKGIIKDDDIQHCACGGDGSKKGEWAKKSSNNFWNFLLKIKGCNERAAHLLLIYGEGKDNYKSMSHQLTKISHILKNMEEKGVKIHGKHYRVQFHLVGDWKFLRTVLGLSDSPQTAAFCCWCLVTKDDDQFDSEIPKRTFDLEKHEPGQVTICIFAWIPWGRIHPDLLHGETNMLKPVFSYMHDEYPEEVELKIKEAGLGVSFSESQKGKKVSLVGGTFEEFMNTFHTFKDVITKVAERRSESQTIESDLTFQESTCILKLFKMFIHFWNWSNEKRKSFQSNFLSHNPEISFDFCSVMTDEEIISTLEEYKYTFGNNGFYPHFLGNEGLQQSKTCNLMDYTTQSIESMNSEIKFLIERSNKARTGADYIMQFLYVFLKKQDFFFLGLPDYEFKFPISEADVHYV